MTRDGESEKERKSARVKKIIVKINNFGKSFVLVIIVMGPSDARMTWLEPCCVSLYCYILPHIVSLYNCYTSTSTQRHTYAMLIETLAMRIDNYIKCILYKNGFLSFCWSFCLAKTTLKDDQFLLLLFFWQFDDVYIFHFWRWFLNDNKMLMLRAWIISFAYF